MEQNETKNKLKKAVDVLKRMKALDAKVIEVTQHCSYADYFILVSATSSTHAQSLSDALSLLVSKKPLQPEGYNTGQWILTDLEDIIVHIFQKDVRAFYQLDKLWSHAPSIKIDLEEDKIHYDLVSTL